MQCTILFADKQVSPKSGTLKSPPKGFDTSAISKTYYNLVSVEILIVSLLMSSVAYGYFSCIKQKQFTLIFKIV